MSNRFSDIPDAKYVIEEKNRAGIELLEKMIRGCIDIFNGVHGDVFPSQFERINHSTCMAEFIINNSYLLIDCEREVKQIEAELREKGYIFSYETCQLGAKFTLKLRENNKIMSNNSEMNESVGNIQL